MAEAKDLKTREKNAWKEFDKRMDFMINGMEAHLGGEVAKNASELMLIEMGESTILFKQRMSSEIADSKILEK